MTLGCLTSSARAKTFLPPGAENGRPITRHSPRAPVKRSPIFNTPLGLRFLLGLRLSHRYQLSEACHCVGPTDGPHCARKMPHRRAARLRVKRANADRLRTRGVEM